MTADTRLWKWMVTLLVVVLGALYWLLSEPERPVAVPATATPTMTLRVVVRSTDPPLLPPTWTPEPTPYAPFDFLPVRSPDPTATATMTPEPTATPEPAPSPERSPIQRG